MSFFQNPVGGAPRDPFDSGYHAEPVGEDKGNKGGPPSEPPPQEKLGIAAFLLQTLQNAVDFLLRGTHRAKAAEAEHFIVLKALFEIMKKEDRSQDTQFLGQLSRMWRHVLEDAIHLQNDLFKTLVKKIQRYPEKQTYTFGYYLAEHRDQKWIPFPYMELIAKIHADHTKNPASSSLTEWTGLLDQLIALLKQD